MVYIRLKFLKSWRVGFNSIFAGVNSNQFLNIGFEGNATQ